MVLPSGIEPAVEINAAPKLAVFFIDSSWLALEERKTCDELLNFCFLNF